MSVLLHGYPQVMIPAGVSRIQQTRLAHSAHSGYYPARLDRGGEDMDESADVGFRRSPGWLVVLAMLVCAQGWLTLRLFGPGIPADRITNDDPVLDGRHPLHSYHGLLGSRVWHARATTTCYDPAFQAGYLKTPIFDSGSRPAELFYLIGGPGAGSYKLGLAVCCLLAPIAFALAARGIGLGAGHACLGALVG